MILVLALSIASQDKNEELDRCSAQMSHMGIAMYLFAVERMEPEGSFPRETGPDFWNRLVVDGRIEANLIRCPVMGRRYRGPKSSANHLGLSQALSLCEHGDKVVVLAKSGDRHIVDRDSDAHRKALDITLGFLGWEVAGSKWTYAAESAAPLVIEAREILSLDGVPGAVLETSGGDLKEPVRETLFADESGVVRFGGAPLGAEEEKKTESLLKDLSSEDYDVREKATAGLAALYPRARDRIEKALGGDDVEIRGRLRSIRTLSLTHAPRLIAYPPKGDPVNVKTGLGDFRGWKISEEVIWSPDLHLPLAITRAGTIWTLKEYAAGR